MSTESTPPTPGGDVPIGRGLPEQLFSVSGFRREALGFAASMVTGPWNLTPSGRPTVGSLGVLVDDVLALSVADHSPSGASVSTEITIDLLTPVPSDGGVLTCVGAPVHVDALGAFVQGRVTDADGHLVAVATQRQRFVPAVTGYATPGRASHEPAAADVLPALTGAVRTVGDRTEFDVAGSPHLANPAGAVHGGMSLYVSAVLADATLNASGTPLPVASIRIAHVRPMPVDVTVIYAAETLHAGRTLRIARVTGRGPDQRAYTVATVTMQG